MRIKSIFVVAILISCISGCVKVPQGARVVNTSTSELPTMQSTKSEIFNKIKIGMPLSEFRQLAPESYAVGQSNEMTAYELAYEQKYVTKGDIARQKGLAWLIGSRTIRARTYRQVQRFYFYQDRLVQWGQSNVWPTKPEMVLEKDREEKAAEPNVPITISPKVLQCENCGHTIGKLEKAYVYEGHIVCSQCYSKLKQQP